MDRPEVAEVLRRGIPKASFKKLSVDKRKALGAIMSCRTKALGAHVRECSSCGEREQSYNSCWNRHCPKCQGGKSFAWVEQRASELLDVPYFHLVFTLPKQLRALCYRNKKLVYDVLFRCSSEALQQAARARYNVQIGFFSVLHSWNQELEYHPHIHQVVAACGLDSLGNPQQIANRGKFFLPVRVLSALYQGKVIAALKTLHPKLYLEGKQSHLKDSREFEHLMSRETSMTGWCMLNAPLLEPSEC